MEQDFTINHAAATSRVAPAHRFLECFGKVASRGFTGEVDDSLLLKCRQGSPWLALKIMPRLPATGDKRIRKDRHERPCIAPRDVIRRFIADAAAATGSQKFSLSFLLADWEDIVAAWQLDSWESFRDVKSLGRKTRLAEPQRAALWSIFAAVRVHLHADGLITHAEMFTRLSVELAGRTHPPFEYVVVDEAQDISIAQLRFLAAIGAGSTNSLFFAGDLGQRIFQQPFSWSSLGVDIRDRARTLHINYRTSHQIRMQADRLLGPDSSDVDGNTEERRGTVSVFTNKSVI